MRVLLQTLQAGAVSLFTREWIEIADGSGMTIKVDTSPSLRGSGLKSGYRFLNFTSGDVSLFTREWIEIQLYQFGLENDIGLPLYEGVD